ncbi:DUF2336 domain-containing protein [Phreatobacter aquaticus]|nr:DUF2336 domain-containing protein [Phreatobacter aquaticus]
MYLSHPEGPSEIEEELFVDILERVLDSGPPQARAALADQLADSVRTPHAIAQRLAWDDNEAVSNPIIARSPVLAVQDLLSLAAQGSDARLQAVALRRVIPAAVTDVLIERGSAQVLKTVAGNQGAEISNGGMMRLATRGSNDIDILEALFKRGDLQPDSIVMLKGVISDDFARRLTERGIDVDGGVAAKALRSATGRFREEMRQRREDVKGAERLLAAIEAGTLTVDRAVHTVLEKKRLLEVASLMAPLLGLSRNFVFHTLATGASDRIAVMFRALDISYGCYVAAVALRKKKSAPTAHGADAMTALLQDEFDAIDVAVAQRSMRFLKVRLSAA